MHIPQYCHVSCTHTICPMHILSCLMHTYCMSHAHSIHITPLKRSNFSKTIEPVCPYSCNGMVATPCTSTLPISSLTCTTLYMYVAYTCCAGTCELQAPHLSLIYYSSEQGKHGTHFPCSTLSDRLI